MVKKAGMYRGYNIIGAERSKYAGVEGIEPSSWVLETQVLPLNDTPIIDLGSFASLWMTRKLEFYFLVNFT